MLVDIPGRVEASRLTRRCAWCGRAIDSRPSPWRAIVRCACGVANTNPWPTKAELDAAYAGWYRPRSGRFWGLGDAVLRRTRGQLARRLDGIAPHGPILDVGAGDGSLLDALRGRGRSVLGVERESNRPDVTTRGLEELNHGWAAIVFWHALEHLPDPGPQLECAAGLLARRGILVVAAPNLDSLQARTFGDHWFALDPPRHLVHIPARALTDRLRALDLAIERVSYWRGGQVVFGWLHGLVGSLPGHPDLYDAIRRPAARRRIMPSATRAAAVGSAALLAPLAVAAAGIEIAARRGGSVYVEARRG